MRTMALSFVFLVAGVSSLRAIPQDELKEMMYQNLGNIENTFKIMYAPRRWKEQYCGWNLPEEIGKVRKVIETTSPIKVTDYQDALVGFFRSTRDCHVGASFCRTESASLPLVIKGVKGRYLLAYIDRTKLPAESFPFQPGDEVVSFDAIPTADVVAELKKGITNSNDLTNTAIAMMQLTSRSAPRHRVPQGAVNLEIKSWKDGIVRQHQLFWKYAPELGNYDLLDRLESPSPPKSWEGDSWEGAARFWDKNMEVSFPRAETDSPFNVGRQQSFVPELGEKIWEAGEKGKFYAYIFRTDSSKLIGFVRIPAFFGRPLDPFAEIIKKFESSTDALVIDQIDNPGGSVLYLYTMASMLTPRQLITPKHRMTITPEQVLEAQSNVEKLQSIDSNEAAIKFLGATLGSYPVTYQLVQSLLASCRFISDEWKAGRRLTRPGHIAIDRIAPHPRARYSKPILLLINELDFSGGDFFPTIMQDNKRVTILGTNTAGAGGYLLIASAANLLGVIDYSCTGSIAERVTGNPIENLGVKADLWYEPTEKDYQENFCDYKKAILEAVDKIATPE